MDPKRARDPGCLRMQSHLKGSNPTAIHDRPLMYKYKSADCNGLGTSAAWTPTDCRANCSAVSDLLPGVEDLRRRQLTIEVAWNTDTDRQTWNPAAPTAAYWLRGQPAHPNSGKRTKKKKKKKNFTFTCS